MIPPSAGRTIRTRVVEAALEMNRSGINHGTSGNVSARLEDPGMFVITPTAVPYDEVAPGSLSRVSLAGAWHDGAEPSTEWRLHRAIYEARPDVEGIVHAHPLHASAVACLRLAIPAFHYSVPMFGGADIRCAPYAPYGTEALARASVQALEDRRACLMSNHGIVAIGETVEEALRWAQQLEVLAAMFLAALSAGSPVILAEPDVAELLAKFKTYGRSRPATREIRRSGGSAGRARALRG
ncbi:MAG: class II aldolase/adducin family protein [Planctomycetota bacterium]